MAEKITFSFFRDYQRYTGGHQKFRDYLLHTAALDNVKCELFVQNDCAVMPGFFQNIENITYQTEYNPNACNVVFLAGMDWQQYLPHHREGNVVVNLIQHVRHGDENHPLFQFLGNSALRICVSEAVKRAIEPHANGTCIAIPMGHEIPTLTERKCHDLYILAKKNPTLGRQLADWAQQQGLNVLLHDNLVNKQSVITSMAQARITVALPNPTEGFFLPGIEAMALSDRAIVPDCIANREYCVSDTNIDICSYSFDDCRQAILTAFDKLKQPHQPQHKQKGEALARSYTLHNERQIYQRIIRESVIPSPAA